MTAMVVNTRLIAIFLSAPLGLTDSSLAG